MKTKILIMLFSLITINVMGQGTISRKKVQKTTTTQKKTQRKLNSQENDTYVEQTPKQEYFDVTINCNVPQATLYIDGNNSGSASGYRTLKEGYHSFRLTAQGYKELTWYANISSQNRYVNLTMEKDTPKVHYFRMKPHWIFPASDFAYIARNNINVYSSNENLSESDRLDLVSGLELVLDVPQKYDTYMSFDGKTFYDPSGTLPNNHKVQLAVSYLGSLCNELLKSGMFKYE